MRYNEKFIIDLTNILHSMNALGGRDARALKEDFAKRSDLSYEEFLIDENIVTKQQLLKALEVYYKVPCVDVLGIMFDHHLVKMFPKDVLLRNCFIPYKRDGDVLAVIASYPTDANLPEIMGKFVSYDVTFFVGYFNDIIDCVEDFYDTSVIDAAIDQDLLPDERVEGSVHNKRVVELTIKDIVRDEETD